jgi:hypothetical protein
MVISPLGQTDFPQKKAGDQGSRVQAGRGQVVVAIREQKKRRQPPPPLGSLSVVVRLIIAAS